MSAEGKPPVVPAHARAATGTALDLIGRAAILAEAADQLKIGVAGISAVGQTVSLTLAYGQGHAAATRIFEALGCANNFAVDDFTVSGRPNYQAVGTGSVDGEELHIALWFSEPFTAAELEALVPDEDDAAIEAAEAEASRSAAEAEAAEMGGDR